MLPLLQIHGFNPSESDLSQPTHSTAFVDYNVGIYITTGFLLFVLYVAWRIRRSIRKEKETMRRNNNPF